jgi:uncharacterized protein YyaL (SSP411 family)
VEVLTEVARVWREERHRVTGSAGTIVGRLRQRDTGPRSPVPPDTDVLRSAVWEFSTVFDGRRGGFGDAPKFPRPAELLFLLREHARTGEAPPRDMALVTLRAMALGGMRDHLGGGFHRYSVDGAWRVPHFEKMLYDQAQLVLAYLEGGQLTRDQFYLDVAADTLAYVQRDLTHPEGGFYSAEDADSVPPEHVHEAAPHKSEGAFYIWPHREIHTALGEDADLFCLRYGVLPDGNAPSDPQGEFAHKNLLYTARSIEDIASHTGRHAAAVDAALERARAVLLSRRNRRPRPHLDDKVLTAWNGLMIAAFARAGRVLDRRYLEHAVRAAEFVRRRLWDERSKRLLRRFRDGEAGIDGYAEDHAYLIWGLLELFQACGDPQWLEWAVALQSRQDELFWDPIEAGWFSTTGRDPSLLLRLKEDYDGAEPAASSVSVLNLLVLAHLTGGQEVTQKVERTLGAFADRIVKQGRAVPMMLTALSAYHAGLPQVVLVGDRNRADLEALDEVVRRRYLPTAITLYVSESAAGTGLERQLPWTAGMVMLDGRATAYVCRDFACELPTASPEELALRLDAGARVPRGEGTG